VYICPLVGIRTLPTCLSLARVPAPPPRTGGGGGEAHSPAGEGLGESQFRRLEKKLNTLPIVKYVKLCERRKTLSYHLFTLASTNSAHAKYEANVTALKEAWCKNSHGGGGPCCAKYVLDILATSVHTFRRPCRFCRFDNLLTRRSAAI
jgi:hypothetical protein